MGKFYGIVGFVKTEENPLHPGVFDEVATEKTYYGEVIRNVKRWQGVADKVNDDVTIDAQISIICNPYLLENMSHIRFIEWMGAPWKVTSVEPAYPRLILSIGGVYNGIRGQETATTSDSE